MKIITIVFALLFSAMVAASPLKGIVVFGDSLSDNGNLWEYMQRQIPQSPPYYKGHFTNGPVWIELLTKAYYPQGAEKHLEDYAFGGAGILSEADDDEDSPVFTLRKELDAYFISHDDKADADRLYVVWIGANNYLAEPDDENEAVSTTLEGINKGLTRLVEKGAKNILVVNLPDLGLTPYAMHYQETDKLTRLSQNHNSRLKIAIDGFENQYPDVHWLYFDVSGVMKELIQYPGKYGYTNVLDACNLSTLSQARGHQNLLKMVASVAPNTNECMGYLFFDDVHPTARTHLIMAKRTQDMLVQQGVVFH